MTADTLLRLAEQARHDFGEAACWPWRTGKKGRIWVDGKIQLASRMMLSSKLGRPVEPGLFACHTCDNPPCFNPAHLYEGTPKSNAQDMHDRGRSFSQKDPARCRAYGVASGRKNDWSKGEGNPKAILTVEEVAAIRASTEGPRALARRYEVHRTTIQRIKRGAAWTAC